MNLEYNIVKNIFGLGLIHTLAKSKIPKKLNSLTGFGLFALYKYPLNIHRQLKTILPLLILSSIKQKLTLEPNEKNESAGNDLTVLPGDLDTF